jgi:hypothetical protein
VPVHNATDWQAASSADWFGAPPVTGVNNCAEARLVGRAEVLGVVYPPTLTPKYRSHDRAAPAVFLSGALIRRPDAHVVPAIIGQRRRRRRLVLRRSSVH